MTEPFDRDLYSRVMADMTGYGDTTHYALGHRHGYEESANVAARISAERQPVSDEELASIFADAIEAAYTRNPSETDGQHIIAGIRAVRAAIAPQVPVISDGWQVDHAACCLTRVADQRDIHRTGSNWMAALTAAIEAAKETTNE
jgi:hypothetical protein